MAKTGNRVDPHAAYRFAVQIDGINEAIFSECTLPSFEVELHEQKEGGYNTGVHQLPGRVKAGRMTLKRGLAQSNELLKWYLQVLSGKVTDARKKVTVIMYDSKASVVLRWTFDQAYPVKWTAPSFKTSESTVAIETLELAFSEIAVE